MSNHFPSIVRFVPVAACVGMLALAPGHVRAQQETSPSESGGPQAVTVDGQVTLRTLVSLSDGHLQKTADVLTLLAARQDVRSGDWDRVREPLAEAARLTVPAVHWFALPDGTYWTLEGGRVAANLSDRAYFPRALRGETVIGTLVVSHSSGRNTAIVAVPVRGPDGTVVGVLGSSVHLDSLAGRIRQEMGGLGDDLLFYAIDAEGLGALHSDAGLIFTEPLKLGDEGMRRAFEHMLAGREGVVTYDFRGSRRTVLYRRSPVTGWWYGFGRTEPNSVGAEGERIRTEGRPTMNTQNPSQGVSATAEVEVQDAFRQVPAEKAPRALRPADLEWIPDPLDPTRSSALLAGDPTRPGPYTFRVRVGPGYALGMHVHPTEDEHLTVLSGSVHWSTGAAGSGAAERVIPAGGFILTPAGTPHRVWTTEATVLQLTGVGPRLYHYLNPADDPRAKQ